jgi:hypothetical protein
MPMTTSQSHLALRFRASQFALVAAAANDWESARRHFEDAVDKELRRCGRDGRARV